MKYHDNMAQANDILTKVVEFLAQLQLPVTPTNYSVAYEHVSGTNAMVSDAINKRCDSSLPVDSFFFEELYTDLILNTNPAVEGLVDGVDNMLSNINDSTKDSNTAINEYLELLDQGLLSLDENSSTNAKEVVSWLIDATYEIKNAQQKLQEQILDVTLKASSIKMELDEVKNERMLDTLTGMHNRKSMQENVDIWLTEKPERQIAAIAIDIDHFRNFNDNYGAVIGDVVLSKVAKKIQTYVKESGLPVRAGGEEFLVLLPDVEIGIAKEVAEQIRKGVEKMRFVSSRSKRTLPKITVSAGVSNYQTHEDWEHFVGRANDAVQKAKDSGRNCVYTEDKF